MRIIKIVILFMLSILITSCSEKDKEASSIQLTEMKEKGFHKEIMPANEDYPKGYLDIDFGDVHIRAPLDYVAQNSENNDFFDLVVMYPSMLSGDKYAATGLSGTDRKRFDRSVRIMFEYKSHSFANLNKALEKFNDRDWIEQSHPSDCCSGLLKHVKNSGLWFYEVSGDKYLTNDGMPIIFYCHKFGSKQDSLASLNNCVWHIHIKDTSIRVNLKQSHLHDWRLFITNVSTFLESIVISGQPVVRIRN